MVSLFPIKPVGCCNNAKCYVSLDEFKELKEEVETKPVARKVDYEIDVTTGNMLVDDTVHGLYIVWFNGGTYTLLIDPDKQGNFCYSNIGRSTSTYEHYIFGRFIDGRLNMALTRTGGLSDPFNTNAELYVIEF